MNKHEKFLEFNGKNIVFLSVDGTYWIPLKPICEALNIDSNRSFQNAKKHKILGPKLAVQQMQVAKNGRKQLRNVTCIPEKYIYGWIFSLRSDSEELQDYQETCYELLYNHFHGVITNRKELLIEKDEINSKIGKLELELKEDNLKYKELNKLKDQRKTVNTKLTSFDKELIKQPELFSN